VLTIEGLHVSYGQVQALRNVSLELNKGEIFAVLGSNGAGKTSLMRTIMGLQKPRKGNIRFFDSDITSVPTYKRIFLGLSLVAEGRALFPDFTVYENLYVGAYARSNRVSTQREMERMYDLFPRLKERRLQKAGSLSGGEQQMLAFARALMSDPKVLLMDEPSMGIMPSLVTELFKVIARLPSEGVSVLLVEQNASKALSIAQRAVVLEMGRVVLAGTGADLCQDPKVKVAYLGETKLL
jgi:branched-chain amino acid transport system ATP-binding protein